MQKNTNFIFQFLIDLGQQIDDINIPKIQTFFSQMLIVTVVTSFFSIFFHLISFYCIKMLIWIYNI